MGSFAAAFMCIHTLLYVGRWEGGRLDCMRWKGEGERVLIIELRCLVWVTILSRLVGNQIIIRNDPHFMLTGFSLSGGMCKRSSEGTHICMYNKVIL